MNKDRAPSKVAQTVQSAVSQVSKPASRPGNETICRACGEPKSAHEPDCPMDQGGTGDPPVAAGHRPGASPLHINHCLNCPTEIAPQENFCAQCFSQLPDDLLGAWFNCRTQNARLYALQGMLDHLARPFADQHDPKTCHHCQGTASINRGEPSVVAQTVQSADLREQGICDSKGPQDRSASLARSQSQVANLQADPELLSHLHTFLYNLGTIELFRCADCGCTDTDFIDKEAGHRYETLLARLTKALEAKQ